MVYFEQLKKIGKAKLRVITVINNKNINEIIPLMKEIQARGVDFHSVMLLRGETLDDDVELPDIKTLNELAKEMFEILSNYKYGLGGLSSHILRNYHRYMWKVSIDTIIKNR